MENVKFVDSSEDQARGISRGKEKKAMEDETVEEPSFRRSGSRLLPCRHHPWLVVLASFICHNIVYGICWTVGVWNVVFLNEFGQSATRTSVVGALVNAVLFVASFAASFLIRIFGCRKLVLLGKRG